MRENAHLAPCPYTLNLQIVVGTKKQYACTVHLRMVTVNMVTKWVAITNFIFDNKIKNINARAMLFSVFHLKLGQSFIWYWLLTVAMVTKWVILFLSTKPKPLMQKLCSFQCSSYTAKNKKNWQWLPIWLPW